MNYISKKEAKKLNIDETTRLDNNNKFIENGLVNLKDYFDNLYTNIDSNIKLDLEQRVAILTDEDYSLVIAGAGSGKTTTMASKVKYLVDIKNINPKDIVIISFTNKAVDELRKRINIDFKIDCLIATFHKFGMILLNNKKYKIINNSYDLVKDYFDSVLCQSNKLLRIFYKEFKKYFKIPFIALFFKSFNSYYNFVNKIKIFKLKNKDFYYSDFIYFCINIINNMKVKNYKFKDNDVFMTFINNLYIFYNNKLNKNDYLDFEDIIIKATESLNARKLNYKYIIVDEYQDISYQRFRLLKKVSEVSNSKVIAVGDDFQSIYSFSGSDINLFIDFEKKFGYASVLKITHTYRNSQQLIDIAGNFIMKNNKQIKKELVSNKSLEDCLEFVLYKDRIKSLNYCLEDIVKKYGPNQKILLLGRYSYDINPYLSYDFKLENGKVKSFKLPYLDITFLTVHSSKGLGFD